MSKKRQKTTRRSSNQKVSVNVLRDVKRKLAGANKVIAQRDIEITQLQGQLIQAINTMRDWIAQDKLIKEETEDNIHWTTYKEFSPLPEGDVEWRVIKDYTNGKDVRQYRYEDGFVEPDLEPTEAEFNEKCEADTCTALAKVEDVT